MTKICLFIFKIYLQKIEFHKPIAISHRKYELAKYDLVLMIRGINTINNRLLTLLRH